MLAQKLQELIRPFFLRREKSLLLGSAKTDGTLAPGSILILPSNFM
jgi:hypothetical protein